MGVSASVLSGVGICLSTICEFRQTTEKQTRYDNITGKPYEHIVETKEYVLSNGQKFSELYEVQEFLESEGFDVTYLYNHSPDPLDYYVGDFTEIEAGEILETDIEELQLTFPKILKLLRKKFSNVNLSDIKYITYFYYS